MESRHQGSTLWDCESQQSVRQEQKTGASLSPREAQAVSAQRQPISLRPTPFGVQHKLMGKRYWLLGPFRFWSYALKEDLVANDPEATIISLLYHLHYDFGPNVGFSETLLGKMINTNLSKEAEGEEAR